MSSSSAQLYEHWMTSEVLQLLLVSLISVLQFSAFAVTNRCSAFNFELLAPFYHCFLILDRVLQHFAQSSSARLNLLLKDLQLGDKRPPHLLSEMRNLAPAKMEDDILQTLWLQRLPANLQQILSVCKASLDELAQIVDKIHEVSGCNLIVARVESNSDQFELDAIKAEWSQFTVT
ncbi:hypothetical protein AVEN_239736-1 [Araneus ventricosus]|uniref:Uncharacterized protein n=1 Tax=Araneus ventricosus TaxID=182803 RepID=A0A4Y2U7G2_ARAVE|nr:hypothetical protein AVEN_239736-1 [Araneus ventricosus]